MTLLDHLQPSLPSSSYFDPLHYQRELESIWWREWICVARTDEWEQTGDFRRVHIGDQQVVITRMETGALSAFHNSCRHRGSLLCTEATGRFARQRIVCPYHAWTYGLNGELLHTPRRIDTDDFSPGNFSLHPVALETWAGFVFINLSKPTPGQLESTLGSEARQLANWPLAELTVAHRETHRINCNWKVFWENFSECYHCPGVHPGLCRLVPLYLTSLSSPEDLPDSNPLKAQALNSRLAPGAQTWSKDGKSVLPWFAGLSAEEQTRGMTFCTTLPSLFIVAHVDYVRSVRVLPLGPEQTGLTVDWLLLPQTLQVHDVDIAQLTALGNQVVLEDARVCELNQQGLHCRQHEHGVLLPQEYDVLAFNRWVLQRLGRDRN